ncbi:MAG TPA: dihydrofolate reductase [Streptosporangiaceae bacterium]
MIISLVVAAAKNEVIGRDGALPWHLPDDLRRFRALTTGQVVVMGRLTHESIVARLGHPLAGRTSVVVSSTLPDAADERVVVAGSVGSALEVAASISALAGSGEVFVIGGESVYRQVLPSADRIYLTRVHAEEAGDRRMPDRWLAGFELVSQEDATDPGTGTACSYLLYQRARP